MLSSLKPSRTAQIAIITLYRGSGREARFPDGWSAGERGPRRSDHLPAAAACAAAPTGAEVPRSVSYLSDYRP